MLIKRSLFMSLGGFNSNLFMWGEDALFALELQKRGIATTQILLNLLHVGGHSLRGEEERKTKAFLMARNRILILRAKFRLGYKIIYFPAVLMAMALNLVLRKIPEKTGTAYLKGMVAGLTCSINDFFPAQESSSLGRQ